MRWIASGRPAPRYAAIGVVLVTAACQLNSTFGIDVHVLRHHLREERQERADRRVRAGVGDRAHAQAGDRAVALQAELDVVDLAAAVPHRDHVLGAGLGPLHRPAEQQRGLGRRAGARRSCPALAPNPPPTAALRAAHDARVEAELRRELVAHAVRALRRDPEREAAGGLAGHRDDAVRLHRHRRDALVDDALRARRRRRRRARLRPGRCPSRWRRSIPAPRTRRARRARARPPGRRPTGSGS